MARLEGKIGDSGKQPVDSAEILEALEEEQRREAVRRYFSGSEGWREASASLGGAFAAEEAGTKAGSKDDR